MLSKGHAAIGLYPVLADVGFFDPALLDNYTRLHSPFGDHPDMRKIPGADFSSGSLGHGLSVTLGMALAARVQGRTYRTYCMLGDGELAEGQVWEAAMAAGHYQAGQPRRDRRPQSAVDRRHHRDRHGRRAARRQVRAPSAGTCAASTATTSTQILDTFATRGDRAGRAAAVVIADTVKGRGVRRMEFDKDWHVGQPRRAPTTTT